MTTQYIDEERVQPVRIVESNGTAVPQGALSDAAWNGSGNPASVIALQKAIYAKLVEIATNTAPAP